MASDVAVRRRYRVGLRVRAELHPIEEDSCERILNVSKWLGGIDVWESPFEFLRRQRVLLAEVLENEEVLDEWLRSEAALEVQCGGLDDLIEPLEREQVIRALIPRMATAERRFLGDAVGTRFLSALGGDLRGRISTEVVGCFLGPSRTSRTGDRTGSEPLMSRAYLMLVDFDVYVSKGVRKNLPAWWLEKVGKELTPRGMTEEEYERWDQRLSELLLGCPNELDTFLKHVVVERLCGNAIAHLELGRPHEDILEPAIAGMAQADREYFEAAMQREELLEVAGGFHQCSESRIEEVWIVEIPWNE